jgi:hypothetical protein
LLLLVLVTMAVEEVGAAVVVKVLQLAAELQQDWVVDAVQV